MRKVVSWDKYFIEIAKTVSIRSKDPSTQVGCVIVNKDGHIIGTGYNGMPPNFPEDAEIWERPAKYKYVIHAEENALLHSFASTKDAKLYTTLLPCENCSKSIASAGISEVYYLDTRGEFEDSIEYLRKCGISCFKVD